MFDPVLLNVFLVWLLECCNILILFLPLCPFFARCFWILSLCPAFLSHLLYIFCERISAVSLLQPPPPCWQFLSFTFNFWSSTYITLIWNFYYLNVLLRVLLLSQNVHAQNKILISQLLLISIRVMEEVVAFPSLPAFAKTTILLSSALLKPCSHPWHVHFYQPSYQVNHHSTEQPTKNQERRSKSLWKTKPVLFLFKIT